MSTTTTTTEEPKLSFEIYPEPQPAATTETEQQQQSAEEAPKVEKKISATRTSCCGKPYYEPTLNYRLDITKGGDEIIWGGTYGQMRRKYEKAPVRIFDERGHEDNFSLDKQGFQLVKHKTEKRVLVDEVVPVRGSEYDDECADLMKKCFNPSDVYIISTLTRRRAWNETMKEQETAGEQRPDMEMTKGNLSARFVHCDQSYQGARRQLYEVLGEERAAKHEKHRWAIVNLWRPLEPVINEPLGMTDARSIREDELVDTMHLVPVKWPNKPVENHMWSVKPPKDPEQHKWHFFSGMTEDECLMIKIFDSKNDGRAKRVPHSAFPTPDDYGPARRSTETRCFLFWEDETTE